MRKLSRKAPLLLPIAIAAFPLSVHAQTLEEQTEREIQNFRWNEAIAQYRKAIADDPANAEAWRGLGKILRWQGRLGESREAYAKAAELEPDSVDAALGVAIADRYDHNFAKAREKYRAAAERWPHDDEVARSVSQFKRDANPRIYGFLEDDLSTKERKIGAAAPLLSREEAYYEYTHVDEIGAYVRRDHKPGFIHYFGLNHSLEVSARFSKYKFPGVNSDFGAIDTFQEYRIKYTRPLSYRHTASIRYTARPTRLLNSGAKFTSHKIEAEIRSQWTPRFATLVGTGALRDLDPDANNVNVLKDTALVRVGVEYAINSRLKASATYITNPELDNTIRGTTLGQFNYQVNDGISLIYRFKYNDRKKGDDEQTHYLGARYSPGGHIWAEAGAKYVKRGNRNGVYPLVSLIFRL